MGTQKKAKPAQIGALTKISMNDSTDGSEILHVPVLNGQKRITMTGRVTSWVSYHSRLQAKYKRAICLYAVSHFLDFGHVIQIGSGTTPNALMSEIIKFQTSQKTSLDLTVLTTNLEIAQMGKEAAEDDPKIFGSTQVIITGGTLLPSLNSLVGNYAAENVRSSVIEPNIVFMGVAGIGFDQPDGRITYHFERELVTQESYATRQTRHRVVLCDHTKLGKTTNWCARSGVWSLLENAETCTILSSYPDENDTNFKDDEQNVKEQIELFNQLMKSWRSNKLVDFDKRSKREKKKQLRLLLVNIMGEVIKEVKLWED